MSVLVNILNDRVTIRTWAGESTGVSISKENLPLGNVRRESGWSRGRILFIKRSKCVPRLENPPISVHCEVSFWRAL